MTQFQRIIKVYEKTEDFFSCGVTLIVGKADEDNYSITLKDKNGSACFGVFDGHGGKLASSLCSGKFSGKLFDQLDILLTNSKKYNNAKDQDDHIFDGLFCEAVKRATMYINEYVTIHGEDSGTTATLLVTRRNPRNGNTKLYCVNIGDSRCVLGKVAKDGTWGPAVDLSTDHNLENESEVRRVTEKIPIVWPILPENAYNLQLNKNTHFASGKNQVVYTDTQRDEVAAIVESIKLEEESDICIVGEELFLNSSGSNDDSNGEQSAVMYIHTSREATPSLDLDAVEVSLSELGPGDSDSSGSSIDPLDMTVHGPNDDGDSQLRKLSDASVQTCVEAINSLLKNCTSDSLKMSVATCFLSPSMIEAMEGRSVPSLTLFGDILSDASGNYDIVRANECFEMQSLFETPLSTGDVLISLPLLRDEAQPPLGVIQVVCKERDGLYAVKRIDSIKNLCRDTAACISTVLQALPPPCESTLFTSPSRRSSKSNSPVDRRSSEVSISSSTASLDGRKPLRRSSFIAHRFVGEDGRPMGPLALFGRFEVSTLMTRSIGGKYTARSCVCVPEISVCEVLKYEYARVILATDGVWDMISSKEALNYVRSISDPIKAARELAMKARFLREQMRAKMDDITNQ